MPATPLRPDRIATPPFIDPYLQTLDRIQREPLRPEQLTARARALLVERYGGTGQATEAAFAHGPAGLLSGHTHYFNGFALLCSLEQGTAVAVRETGAPVSHLHFEGSPTEWTFDVHASETTTERAEWPAWACIVKEIVRILGAAHSQVEVVVVSTVQAGCIEAYMAALAVVAARAVQALFAMAISTADLLEKAGDILQACLGVPFSSAYLIAAESGRPQHFTLVDTAIGEHLPLQAPSREQLGWGLIDVGSEPLAKPAVHWEQKAKAEKALEQLRQRGFDHLTSLRDLEYQDLQRALGAVSRRFRRVVRHLATENHRVQRMVLATRRQDWQLFGALLLMSHASLREDWKQTSEEVDFIVEHVEAMTLDGMYGATVSGQGSAVLVVGQPFVVPVCMDRIKEAFTERFGRSPEILLL